MNIRIICIGKLKEAYWRDAVAEYSKRLSRFCRLTIVELKEARLPEKASRADEEAVKAAEGQAILAKLSPSDYVIGLEIEGKQMDSPGLADMIDRLGQEGRSDLAFLIGGSLGLSPAVTARADMHLSFSRLTFPHQMMRVILLEQLYRSYKILHNEAYHK